MSQYKHFPFRLLLACFTFFFFSLCDRLGSLFLYGHVINTRGKRASYQSRRFHVMKFLRRLSHLLCLNNKYKLELTISCTDNSVHVLIMLTREIEFVCVLLDCASKRSNFRFSWSLPSESSSSRFKSNGGDINQQPISSWRAHKVRAKSRRSNARRLVISLLLC